MNLQKAQVCNSRVCTQAQPGVHLNHSNRCPPDLRPTVSGVVGARPPASVLCKMQRGTEPAAARCTRLSRCCRGLPHQPTSSKIAIVIAHHRPCSHRRCQPLPTARPACNIPGSLWTACKKYYMPAAQLGLVDRASGHNPLFLPQVSACALFPTCRGHTPKHLPQQHHTWLTHSCWCSMPHRRQHQHMVETPASDVAPHSSRHV